MNPESELMGKMRLANTVVHSARDLMREVYEDGESMLQPNKTDELVKIMSEIEAALTDIRPIVGEFHALASRRAPHV